MNSELKLGFTVFAISLAVLSLVALGTGKGKGKTEKSLIVESINRPPIYIPEYAPMSTSRPTINLSPTPKPTPQYGYVPPEPEYKPEPRPRPRWTHSKEYKQIMDAYEYANADVKAAGEAYIEREQEKLLNEMRRNYRR
jgi:hypothetical protein